MNINYALVTYGAAPWQRMLKFTDTIAEVEGFPTSAVALQCSAFSPDSSIVLAGESAKVTAAVKGWKRNGDRFESFAVADLPEAVIVYRIGFFTPKHILLNTDRGPYAGLIGVNGGITWTKVGATTTTRERMSKAANGEYIYTAAFATNVVRIFRRNGDTIEELATVSNQPTGAAGAIEAVRDYVFLLSSSTTATIAISSVKRVNYAVNPPVFDTISMAGGVSSITAGYANKLFIVSEDEDYALCVFGGTNPFQLINFSDIKTASPTDRTFGIGTTDLAFPISSIEANWGCAVGRKFLLAYNSDAANLGRVRAYDVTEAGALVEDVAVRTFFSTRPGKPLFISASVAIVPESASGKLYNRALLRLAPGGADLSTLKLMLLSDGSSFDASSATVAQAVAGKEVTGSDWPVGGIPLTGVTFIDLGGGAAGMRFNASKTLNAPGNLTFAAALIYEPSGPLMMLTFDNPQTATQFDNITVELLEGAILRYAQASA